jgi:hypothetical protein
MKLNSRFPARNICNEIATMIFYQQVTEGQLIKKEPINEESLRAKSGIAAGRIKNSALPMPSVKTKRATTGAARPLKNI